MIRNRKTYYSSSIKFFEIIRECPGKLHSWVKSSAGLKRVENKNIPVGVWERWERPKKIDTRSKRVKLIMGVTELFYRKFGIKEAMYFKDMTIFQRFMLKIKNFIIRMINIILKNHEN